MKSFQKYLNQNILFSCIIALVISGCSKTGETTSNTDETVVNINVVGSESNTEEDIQGKVAKAGSSDLNNNIQTTVIPFDDNFSLIATLSLEGVSKENSTQQRNNTSDNTSIDARAATGPVRTNLAANVKYKVLVYNSTGTRVAEKDYSYGNEATTGGIPLDGETTYTFIAYSINSTSTLPAAVNSTSLSTVNVPNVTGDLMYFKESIKLKKGNNNLNVVLKHKFSQITTTISLDPASTGTITALSTPFIIKPTRTSASINLSTGNLTYNAVNTNGTPVTFGALNGRSVASTPTQIISPAITNGTFDIGSITMNNLTKGPISIPNLRINPGCKYNLNLAFTAPCTQTVNTTDFAFSVQDGTTKTFSAPAADFGFVFDLFEIDNSFNLKVNNVLITTQEIQFEGTQGATGGQNLKFADNSYWGDGTVPQVYNMIGTTGKPVIRITIDGNGKVAMFGSKVANGPLFPLVLSGTATFNTVTWTKTGANAIVASQTVKGPTYLKGEGFGKKVIPCN